MYYNHVVEGEILHDCLMVLFMGNISVMALHSYICYNCQVSWGEFHNRSSIHEKCENFLYRLYSEVLVQYINYKHMVWQSLMLHVSVVRIYYSVFSCVLQTFSTAIADHSRRVCQMSYYPGRL